MKFNQFLKFKLGFLSLNQVLPEACFTIYNAPFSTQHTKYSSTVKTFSKKGFF